ncbi:protein SON isoform X2 [Motacilla alba alba]|uniref:protein SON isoform X2 n=1 Tax=Motacilla alba alba TaxID=1094192 RepID=UPI0018D524FA|nr:protein SON isoform X2 [Motacilla alba alba]
MESLPIAAAGAAPQPAMASAGATVEGQPNGDTVPAEQAGPSEASGAAGSCQSDQIVQKIEEVLSGALGTELQCNPDVDKNTVKNSTQSTKRSSTGEDEIPRKKAKKNKKHKSKKKKKKKKKRKKEKKHKKQPKESKLSARPGEPAGVQPAPHLVPEQSSSQLNVQHGVFADANLAGHVQPQLCSKPPEGLDNQALGLVSHSVTDSQQSAENLGSGEGTLCAANPPFNLESIQSNIPENTSIAQTRICTSEEQIQQSHENIYPVAINASVVGTGNNTWSSIPSGIDSKSEIQKDSVEALGGTEVTLKSQGIGEIKASAAALEPETMEVLTYSEASHQSVSQRAAQGLETASESMSLASGVTTTPASANWAHPSAVTVTHMAVAGQEVKIPETTEKSLHMGSVRSVEGPSELRGASITSEPSLQPSVVSGCLNMTQGSPLEASSVVKASVPLQHPLTISAATPVTHVEISAKTPPEPGAVTKVKDAEPAMGSVKALETTMVPVGVVAKDVRAAHESLQGRSVEGTTGSATAPGASGMFLQHGVLTDTRSVDRMQGSALPSGLTGMNVVAEVKELGATSEPAAVLQTFVPQTAPEVQMAEGFRSPRAKDSEGTSLLRESRPESESHVRGLAPSLSLQKENTQGPGGVLRPVAVVEAKTFTTASVSLQAEGVKASEEAVHCGTVASPGLPALERTPEPVVARESVEPVREAEASAGVMPWQAAAEREPLHASQTESSIIAQSQIMTHTRPSQTEVLRKRKDSEHVPEAEARSREAVLETVQTSEISSKSVQDQIVGHSAAVLESLPRVEEHSMASGVLTELADMQTQGSAVEHEIAGRRTSTQGNELSEVEKAKYLEPASEAGGMRWLETTKESATVEVKGSETCEEPEVPMGDASAAVPEYLHAEKQQDLQVGLEAKPAAEWKSSEEAPETLGASEIKSCEAVPKPGDMKGLETTLEHEVTAEVQYVEGVQSQQAEDMVIEKEDAEQTQASEPLVAETVFSSSHAAEEKVSAGTPVAETQDLETAPRTDAELKDAEATVGLEAETKDLEAAPVPETDAEAGTDLIEEGQLEDTPEAEDVKEATPEEDSEKRDSETSDVQPDVAARMKETLMRLENVIEKSSHRTSEKKHDSKKQKRSRSKSQSRSRKRKKKSRSRSTSRRLTSKRARSRSRNYSVSRKKHSKSRSRSVEKRERRLSSRRSRRRHSRSSDRYRSKSRSAEKRLSRRRRSRSSDHYRSKSRSVEKRLSSRRSRRRRSRSSDRYRSKSRSAEKRLSSRRSGRRRSRSSDRYRSKSRSAEKRLSSRRSGRRRSRSSDRYRSKSRSAEKRLSSRRSGRRRSRSSDRYRSKSRSAEKRLSSRRSGRRRSRSSDRYRSKSRSAEKRLSSWRSRRRHSRSSDRSKSRSRSSEKGGGKDYSWRFRHRSGSSDRSKSRSRSVEKRGRKASVRRSKRQRSKSSDRYKSRSRSVEKRDRKQSSRKSKRQRSKSSDRYKSRSKSVEKKKESSRKSKRRRSKSSERYKSRSRSVEKKRKESSKKSKRKRSKSSDSVKSRSKSVEKKDKLSSAKSSSKHVESSELEESAKGLDKDVPQSAVGSEGKSSNGPTSVALSDEGVNGPVLPPSFGSGLSKTSESLEERSSSVEKTADLQHSATSEFDTSKTPDDQELRSTSVEKTQDSELSMTPENGSTEKAAAQESSLLPELPYSTSQSRSSSVEKRGGLETSSVGEFHVSASREHESRTAPLREVEGPELPPGLKRDMQIQSSSLPSEGGLSNLSDGHESRNIPGEHTELSQVLQVPERESSQLADSPGAVEPQRPFLPPEMIRPVIPDGCESGQMQEPSLASDGGHFVSPDGPGSGSSFAAPVEEHPLSVFKSPHGNEQRFLSVEKVKTPDVSLTSVCGSVEVSANVISVSSFEVHESRSSVDKALDGPTLPQVLEVDCSRSPEMHESRYLTGKIDGAGSLVMSKSGIPICHDGHKAKYNSFEQTESAELSVASELRCSILPEGYKLTSAAVEKVEIQKPSLSLESGFSVSADGCESLGTPEKLQPPVSAVPSEGEVLLLPDSHELRPVPAEKAEMLNSSELKQLASPDGYNLRSAYSEEVHVQEPILIRESRCSVASDGHELASTTSERAEEPSQVSENEYTIGLDGPELTSTPAEKTELRRLYQMPEERCLESIDSRDLQSPSAEETQVQQPALVSENEHAVSWVGQELRSSSPGKAEMQEEAVVPDSAVSSEDHRLPSFLAGKPEVPERSLLPESEYGESPEGLEVTASPAEKEVQEPSLTPGSECSIFHQGQILQSGLTESTAVQEPVLVPDNQYAASAKGQELLCAYAEKPEVQECSLRSENEYEASPKRHHLRSSLVEKEVEEHYEASESESSISTDSHELQPAVARKTEGQELSLSEGECPMTPEGQELQSSPAERVLAKEHSVTSEHAQSPEEYESRLVRAEETEGVGSALTAERDHLFFESQEVSFASLQKADVQDHSPTPENEHGPSPDGQELRFTTVEKVDGLQSLNDRASMSPDGSDLNSIPVEKMDHAMPSAMPEGRSVSPDNCSVGPGEEPGDLEPSLRSERRYSTSSYQEGHEPRSPLEEEGLESSVTSEHRQSLSPEGHDQKSIADEEMDDLERRSTSPDEHESRSSVGEEAEDLEQPLRTERRCSESSDEHESRSTTGEEAEDAETSVAAERRDSISSDDRESRSAAGEDVEDGEPSLTAERRHSTSSDDRESRSSADEEAEDVTAEHRSVSPDGRESRSTVGEEAEDQELSLTAERRHSTSSDEQESRSTAGEDAEDVEPSSAAEQRDSTSSDEQESRSTAGEEAEDVEPLTAEHRRSASPDGAESRSTTAEEEGEDAEPSLTAEQRESSSSDEHESESSSGEEEGEDAEPSLADEEKQDSMPLEQSEEQDSSFVPESRRSESSEREKSRSKSVDKASDKESPQRSVSRHSKSPARQKSRSTSVEKTADKESVRRYRRRRSRSTARQRSQSTSVEKTADKESSRRSRRRRSRSAARQRSQSKSVEKAADKESSRRSRSRRSRSSQRRSKRYDTDSRSRRNRSRSATRRRASRSRSSSLSRSRHRRRSRSRSASRRRRSLSRDRRKRSQRNRSRSTDRRRRRSDSRDRRISLRLRSRSRTPLRQRRSRSRGRRRSSSRSPIRLRRSRSSGRRRYSRSPDRRRSRSSEFSSRSPKRLTDLDKAQLLEIAKANAAAMCAKSGVPLPPSLMPLLSQKKDDKANQKSSRDTLKELTEKCKKIAQSTDDVIVNKPHVSDEEEEERPFYNHPFKLSEPKPIFFNLSTPSIKPAPPPQPKNQVSLSKEFPVSSGSQHRKKEADSVYGEWVPVDKNGKDDGKDDVFPKPAIECVDITTAMNDRAVAQKRLNENSFDLEAMCMLNRAQEQIDAWAQSNSIPGQFTGSTGAQILSSDELTNSGPQAWIRKDQFLRAAPVTGGMGAQLMRKMGWREGEGLGKNKEGSVEPIMVDFKTDRKGLVAVGEKAQKRSGHYVVMKDLSGKHPVSALMEICNKRRWTPPEFVLVDDSGPDHRKHFIFKKHLTGLAEDGGAVSVLERASPVPGKAKPSPWSTLFWDPRAGAPLAPGWESWGCSPGGQKAPGRPQSSLQALKGLQQSCRGTGDKSWRGRTQGMASLCQRTGLEGILGMRNCSLAGWAGPGARSPGQLWLPLHPMQCPRPLGLGAAWGSGRCPCHGRGGPGLAVRSLPAPSTVRSPGMSVLTGGRGICVPRKELPRVCLGQPRPPR